MSRLLQDIVNRRKMWTKVFVFLAMVAVVWFQPDVQTWLDGRGVGGADNSDIDVRQESTSTQHPANRKRVIITDVDQPPVAEIDRSEATSPTRANQKPSVPGRPLGNPGSDFSAFERKGSDADPVRPDSSPVEAQTPSKPVLGKLHEIRNNVFESTAGLRYVPGSADNHRLRHVMQHAADDTTKPVHGVFEGNRDQILAIIDEAWQKAKKGGRDVRSEKQNDRLVYTVNLGRKIGYMGGSEGKRKGNPDCRCLRIVLEDENIVISAYPTKSF